MVGPGIEDVFTAARKDVPTMVQMTILTGPEHRRRWSDEQRERILAEAFAAGACGQHAAVVYEAAMLSGVPVAGFASGLGFTRT